MGKVINFEEWRNENEVLLDPLIDAVPYLKMTFKYAIEALHFKYNRTTIKNIQIALKNIDNRVNVNTEGIVDLNTFAYVCMMAYEDCPDTLNEIKKHFEEIIAIYNELEDNNPDKSQKELLEEVNNKISPSDD